MQRSDSMYDLILFSAVLENNHSRPTLHLVQEGNRGRHQGLGESTGDYRSVMLATSTMFETWQDVWLKLESSLATTCGTSECKATELSCTDTACTALVDSTRA